jgi:hypothetical protein
MHIKYFDHIHPITLSFTLPTPTASHKFKFMSFFSRSGFAYEREHGIWLFESGYFTLHDDLQLQVFSCKHIIPFFFMAE